MKSKTCDDAHTNYSTHVSLYNDTQRSFYERQLPSILTDLQQLDGKRSDELKDVYIKFIQSHAEVLPRIQRCLDEMTKQTEQLNANTDAQVVIEEHKSGYAIPDDEKEV
jgi:thyroid hormone receptor interactor 10